jgi:hypothetical protein
VTVLGPVAVAAEEYGTKGFSGVANAVLDQGAMGAMAITTEAVLTGGLGASGRVNSVTPGGTVTRYMGPGAVAIVKKTGLIPNTDALGQTRPTHLTTDKPLNSSSAAQQIYEPSSAPTHRATVPASRAGGLNAAPDGRPTTSGGVHRRQLTIRFV